MIRQTLDSPWLQHPRVWITVGVLCLMFTVLTWTLNREPPTIMGDQYSIPDVAAGQEVVLNIPVSARDLNRACSVSISRDLYNSNHERSNLIERQFVTAEGRELRAVENPKSLSLRIRVPASTPTGPAKIITDNAYVCKWNPSTWVLPIEDSWSASINVLPPVNVVVVPVSK